MTPENVQRRAEVYLERLEEEIEIEEERMYLAEIEWHDRQETRRRFLAVQAGVQTAPETPPVDKVESRCCSLSLCSFFVSLFTSRDTEKEKPAISALKKLKILAQQT